MKVDQQVGYIDENGDRHQATITKLSGTGKSLNKILDLSYRSEGEDLEVVGVPHEEDAEAGEAFWLEKGVTRKRREEAVAERNAPAPQDEPDIILDAQEEPDSGGRRRGIFG